MVRASVLHVLVAWSSVLLASSVANAALNPVRMTALPRSLAFQPAGLVDGDKFGTTLDVQGDHMVACATTQNVGGTSSIDYEGVCYYYTRVAGSWTYQSSFHGPEVDDENFTHFGNHMVSLSPDGTRCVVTTLLSTVYVFARTGVTFSLEDTITGSGLSIDVQHATDGTYLALGAKSHNINRGEIRFYTRSGSTWTLSQSLSPDAGVAIGDYFGSSVVMDGTTCVVGATQGGSSPGYAIVYTRSGATWTEVETLVASPAITTTNANFAERMSLSGDYLAIATLNDNLRSVYVFHRASTSFTQVAVLLPADNEDDWVARRLAITPSYVVIGSTGGHISTQTPFNEGGAYLYARGANPDDWSEVMRIREGANEGGAFGVAVALSGDRVIIASSGNSIGTSGWVYEYLPEPCTSVSTCDSVPNTDCWTRTCETYCLLETRWSQACDDGNECTDSVCAPDLCVGTNDDANPCSDGNDCTDDVCDTGVCIGSNNDANECSDGNDCTSDVCDAGECVGTADDTASCDDEEACTVNACRAGKCIVSDDSECPALSPTEVAVISGAGVLTLLGAAGLFLFNKRRSSATDSAPQSAVETPASKSAAPAAAAAAAPRSGTNRGHRSRGRNRSRGSKRPSRSPRGH